MGAMPISSLRIALLALGLALATLAPAGCDSGGIKALPPSSGIDRSKYLDQLTPDEIRELCTFVITSEGGSGNRSCGDAGSFHVYTLDECTSGTLVSYHCQVALVEDCLSSLEGDVCSFFGSSACKVYVECVTARRD
jgi:hypothetical protein